MNRFNAFEICFNPPPRDSDCGTVGIRVFLWTVGKPRAHNLGELFQMFLLPSTTVENKRIRKKVKASHY